jgi:hypothetical protein
MGGHLNVFDFLVRNGAEGNVPVRFAVMTSLAFVCFARSCVTAASKMTINNAGWRDSKVQMQQTYGIEGRLGNGIPWTRYHTYVTEPFVKFTFAQVPWT